MAPYDALPLADDTRAAEPLDNPEPHAHNPHPRAALRRAIAASSRRLLRLLPARLPFRLLQLAVFSFPVALVTLVLLRPDLVAAAQYGGLRLLLSPEPQPPTPRTPPNFSPRGCRWRASRPAWFCRSATEAGSPSFEAREALGPLECASRAATHLCAAPSTRTLLAGPFYSRPGEWHSLGFSYDEMLAPSDRIVAYTADVVDSSGAALPYPPVHLHHIHVMRGAGVHWYETHGDYERDRARGYRRALPDGYCDANAQPAARILLAQINDVRFTQDMAMSFDRRGGAAPPPPPHAAAPPLAWFVRLAFELAPPSSRCRAATKLIWWYPVTPAAAADRLSRYDVPRRPALFWWVMRAPRGGRLLPPAWVHSHRARYGGLLLVRGKHSPRSLAAFPRAANLTAARSALLAAAAGRLVCADDEERAPSFARLPPAADGTGGWYDRQGRVVCRQLDIERGEEYTLFSFNEPRWSTDVDPYPQHTMLFMYLDGNASATELAETFPASYGEWYLESGEYHENIDLRAEFAKTRSLKDRRRTPTHAPMIGFRISPRPSFLQQVLNRITATPEITSISQLFQRAAMHLGMR
ncbi:hypothetical protein AB1Y20_006976 [Prymnesium parvum]|uniref:Mannosyltransferase n=1 Tax=Prymnesium parvum TaxID=97485 RepID=A0AB34J2B1_PRYPA